MQFQSLNSFPVFELKIQKNGRTVLYQAVVSHDGWLAGPSHAGFHVGQKAHGQVWPAGRPGPAREHAVTDGGGMDGDGDAGRSEASNHARLMPLFMAN